MILRNRMRISGTELELLEVVNKLGPCSSEKVHQTAEPDSEYLLVLRKLHMLVEKGFLQRIVINRQTLYRTPGNYNTI